MRRADLADLTAFVAVADNLSFRAAASRLGVTPSALSHTMRHFEERLGFRLLNRTTRSVSLTDAGLRLLDRLGPAVEQISQGLEDLKGEQGHPFGHLRLYVTHLAGAAVIAPVWARFLSTFPDVRLEVHAAEAPVDIVAKGFDAGIGPKDWAAADMIAVRVTGPMKVAVVGAPQLRSISPGGGVRVRVAIRAGRQIATNFAGWPSHGQRYRFGGSRSRRRIGNCVYDRSSRRPVPALGAAGTRAGRLVALL
jgi:DNA-binding transcriptional LysR family regulator